MSNTDLTQLYDTVVDDRFGLHGELGGVSYYYDGLMNDFVFLDANNVPTTVNELDVQLTGAATHLSNTVGIESASRQAMEATHLKQKLVVKGATARRQQTGVEREYSKYTFGVRVPENCTILSVVDKYRRQEHALNGIRHNPEKTIIYQEEMNDHGVRPISFLKLDEYSFRHTYLGYKYKHSERYPDSSLTKGTTLPKGTALRDSPCVTRNGDYHYGIETNVAYMSLPATIEDGFAISESYREKLTTTMLGMRYANIGSKYFALNLYGDKDHYKPFPAPGDKIREDGLVMVLRPYDENFTVADLHPDLLMNSTIDHSNDKKIYGLPNAVVFDVDVFKDKGEKVLKVPTGLEKPFQQYVDAKDNYYDEILKMYRGLVRNQGKGIPITPEFHRLIVESLANFPERDYAPSRSKNKMKISRLRGKIPLDNFVIEIKFAKHVRPTMGWKLTDLHGTKGVVVDIIPDADMPTTADGVVADVIIDPLSVIKRSNIGQLFEHFTNMASFQLSGEIINQPDWKKAYSKLMEYYKAASPYMYVYCHKHLKDDHERRNHVKAVKRDGIYLHLPPNSPNVGMQQVRDIEEQQTVYVGPVTYRGKSGRVITTKKAIPIATKYMMMLDKINHDWSAIAFSKRQTHGVLASLSASDKYAQPNRTTSTRIGGESEFRAWCNFMSGEFVADLSDRTNSVEASQEINRNILMSNKPTAEDNLINRRKIPVGGHAPLRQTKNLMFCMGVELVHKPFKPAR